MLQKLTALFMAKENQKFFNVYVKYFPTINKNLKLARGGVITVINNENQQVESYDNWEELNYVYKQLPIDDNWVKENHPNIPFKYWVYGDPNRSKDIKEAMENKYKEVCNNTIQFNMDFKKSDWVYYIDSSNNCCQTNNKMVVDLLQNSSDWTQIKLETKKLTKSDIAKLIGLNVNQFEIV